MLAGWRLCVSEIEFNIIHRNIRKDQAADSLATPNIGGKDYTDIFDDLFVAILDLDENNCESSKVLLYLICHICHINDA